MNTSRAPHVRSGRRTRRPFFTVTLGLLGLLVLGFAVSCSSDQKDGTSTPGTDVTAPGRVLDLSISRVDPTGVTLAWTATGDDGNTGTADSTEIRVFSSEITEENWEEAAELTGVTAPKAAGTAEAFRKNALVVGVTYYFALRVWDEAGHVSAVSNCVHATPSTDPSPQFSGAVGLSTTGLSAGVSFDFTCKVQNSGAASPRGRICLSFPALDQPGDSARVFAAHVDDLPGVLVYVRGDTIEDRQCAKIVAEHLLVVYEDRSWDTGEANTLSITVVPRATGEFQIDARAALMTSAPDSACDWLAAVPADGEPGLSDQQGWPASRFTVTVTSGDVSIVPGSFLMGSPEDEPGRWADEKRHDVTLTRTFTMSDHEVTQAEWRAVMGWDLSSFEGYNLPVEQVTWFDCVSFCNRKSLEQGLTPAYTIDTPAYFDRHMVAASVAWNERADGYRLPTEAEWEYACRAGATGAFCNGPIEDLYCSGDPSLTAVGWYCANARSTTHPVQTRQANAWGLYDMHGNVWEWCWDRSAEYADGPATDPTGAAEGTDRTFRGGGWFNAAPYCRAASRGHFDPRNRNYSLGLRVARTVG